MTTTINNKHNKLNVPNSTDRGNVIRNVPHLRFPEFEGEWEKCPLGKISTKITKKNKGNTIQNVLCNSATLGLIPQNDYFDREIANSNNTEGYYVIEYGDFVYNPRKSVSAPYGPVNIYTGSIKGIISPLYLCFSVHCIMPSFLYYRFKSSVWFPYVYSHGDTGTRFDRVSIKDDVFFEMPIYMPSSKEQIKIANLMALLDERIATQNKIIDKLQSLIKGINQRGFMNNGIDYKLGEICEIRSGYSGSQLLSKKGLKVSRIETISGHKVNVERVGYVAPFESSENYRLRVGDILFSNINSVEYIGNTAFIDKDYDLYHGMNLLRLTPNNMVVIPFYLYLLYLLLNTNRMLNRFKTVCNKAVSQASINQTELGKTVVQIPDINAQKQICELYQALYDKLESEKYANSLFQKQKQYLLRQMFI